MHISKASIRLTSPVLIVHVSAPHSVTLHTSVLTILFLMSLLSPPFNNSFLSVNFSFPIAILFLISLWHFCVVCYQASQVAEFGDLFYFFSVDCYFRILLFSFCSAYLHYFRLLGINFHSIFFSCLIQSDPSSVVISPPYLLPSPDHQRTASPSSTFLTPLFLLPCPAVVLLGLVLPYV